ncbi:myrosinase 1-like [Episyrphus balteatus]|uniref:myrosinase 1-like n=1 Tax=Episyrphus balteatus TaxID=286459 RepID=UPI00248511AD|nr:myrosinase 1-like [Episyrphus balteatus]
MNTIYSIFVIGLLLICSNFISNIESCNYRSKGSLHFPSNFSFGVSTSAYQIEGGWNADGKGVSIWDDFTHNNPDLVRDGSDGDVAINSYNRFDDDLDILDDLKVGHYRFSISWTRIFPDGETKHRNQAGIDYYNQVIDKLLAKGIKPLVTLFHFDLPLEIQKKGGFISSLSIEYFVQYAAEMFKLFGDRVKDWITFNEPWFMCKRAYGDGVYPPLINASGVADYLCIDSILKAHGATYRVYKSHFKHQNGQVGISLNSPYFIIGDSSDKDILERAMQFNMGYLAHPIFSKAGGYPEIMVKDIGRNSLEEGRIMSRLPSLEGEWKDIIRGSADFLGLNYYSSAHIRRASQPQGKNPSFERDANYESYSKFKTTGQSCDPAGLEGLLKWISKEYNNVPVLITENGYRDMGELEDNNRQSFLKTHLQAALNAANDGCNVIGYTHWSLVDNFEWLFGYTLKYGLYSVNMTSPTKDRVAKNSAKYYKKVISSRILQMEYIM